MDGVQGQKTPRKWRMARKVENRIFFICFVEFLYFGPYFGDIGHDFVDSGKS